jgi:hypothetical protein
MTFGPGVVHGRPAAGAVEPPPWSNRTGTVTASEVCKVSESWEGEWSVAVTFTPDLMLD